MARNHKFEPKQFVLIKIICLLKVSYIQQRFKLSEYPILNFQTVVGYPRHSMNQFEKRRNFYVTFSISRISLNLAELLCKHKLCFFIVQLIVLLICFIVNQHFLCYKMYSGRTQRITNTKNINTVVTCASILVFLLENYYGKAIITVSSFDEFSHL